MEEAFVQTWPKSLGLIEIDGYVVYEYVTSCNVSLDVCYSVTPNGCTDTAKCLNL